MKKKDEIEVKIDSLGFGGKGFTKVDGLALFVRNALPGQTLKVKIIKKRKGFAEAIPMSVIEQSKHYVDPECPHFKYCGGCSLQNLNYSEQLEQKSRQVGEVLQHIGGVSGVEIDPIIAAPAIFYYRNKMEFSFSNKRWLTDDDEQKPKDFALGLHVPGNYEKVLDIDDCRLQSEISNKILASVKKSAQEYKFKAYDSKNHSGNLRYLIIKQASNSSDLFVNIVTKYDEPMKLDKIVKRLLKECPEITTVVNIVNDSVASTAYGTKVNVMHGSGLFNEKIGSVKLELGPQEFLQTNTKAAELLYEKIIDYAELNEKMNVFDLYSGVGSISISIASQVQKVTGFELLPEAVESAGRNAGANGVLNCNFIAGDMRELFRDVDYIRKVHGTPDLIILDPPRSGIHPSMPKRISNLKPKKVIYVSCNPASFARDIKLFYERGYKLVKLQPFDLFPHTPHIELVSLLVPKSD